MPSRGTTTRRNLTRDQFTILLGMRYQSEKQHGAFNGIIVIPLNCPVIVASRAPCGFFRM